jgi:drug/metabolite transporter (DMT)-like permease
MVGGSAAFAVMGAFVKAASDEATAMQAVLYRSLFSAVPLLLLLRMRGLQVRSPRWRMLLVRGGIGFLALYLFLWSLSHLRMADVIALQQTSPIFVALLSMLLLRERPRAWYFALVAVCLAGALLVVQPTRGLASAASAVPLVSAMLASLAYVSVRSLTATEPSLRIVTWFVLVSAVVSLPLCIADWRWLSLRANVLLGGAGLLATFGQLLMTAAYRRAPAWVVSAFSYSSVPLGWLIAVLVWREQPDAVAAAGILLIVLGGVLAAWKLRRREVVAAPARVPTP